MTLVQLTRACLARPRLATAALVVVTLAFAAGLPRLRTEFGYRPLLGAEHPEIVKLERFIERFGGGLPVRVAWSCTAEAPCDHALDGASLAMAAQVEQALRLLPQVRSVRGPASAPLLVASPDALEVRRLMESGLAAEDREKLAAVALADPLWQGQLVSEDGRTGALIVQPVRADSATSEALVDGLLDVLDEHQAAGYEFHLVGHAVEFAVAGRELAQSSAALTPITLLVVAGVLWMLTRSWQAVAATLAMLAIALVWTFGLLGWFGWPQDAVLQTLAPLVLVIGVCDAVHLVSRHAARCPCRPSDRPARRGALVSAAAAVARPCLLTSATTAAAFASFATSDLGTFVRFGSIAALATGVCLVLAFTLLPLSLLALPAEPPGREGRVASAWGVALDAIVVAAQRRRGWVLASVAVLVVIGSVGWGRLRVDTDGTEMYGAGSRVVRWIQFVEENLAPSDTLEIELRVPRGRTIAEARVLDRIPALSTRVEAVDGLGRVSSILDPIGHLHAGIAPRGGDLQPAARAELLELLAFEDPELVEAWVSFDRTRARLSVEAGFHSAAQRGPVLAAVAHEVSQAMPGVDFALTGPYAIGHEWVRDVHGTQLRSFAAALLLVFVLLGLHMRSVRWAFVALVPTVLPALVVVGGMGLLGLSLDVGRAMIGAVLVGIGVDDTIHLLDRYRLARLRGVPPNGAMREAVRFAGRAVVTTSLALALGFLSLLASSWQTVSSFGLFVALGVLMAMVADLVVLPALVARKAP